VSGIFVAGYGFAFANILRDGTSVVKAEIHCALSILAGFIFASNSVYRTFTFKMFSCCWPGLKKPLTV
jgi:hypothetical protein